MSVNFTPKSPLYLIEIKDAQESALRQIGRALTEEELEKVKDGLEWGLCECQADVMSAAIDEAVGDPDIDHSNPIQLDNILSI